MTPDTLVEVASNSKVVTALGAVRDIRAGRLNLDRPLAEYRDDFELEGEYADRITLEMLLTHTAGLDNALGRTPAANQHPDDQVRYSGVGFELVGSLIALFLSLGANGYLSMLLAQMRQRYLRDVQQSVVQV